MALLEQVGVGAASARMDDYPHQLSGGTCAAGDDRHGARLPPALLIADEPTTALDVTIQAQILALIARLQREIRNGDAAHHP